jgi:hypothetical protein
MARFVNRVRRQGLRAASAAVVIVASLSAGCVTLDRFHTKQDAPPTGPAAQVVVTWNKSVCFAADPTHNGAPNPGVAGRLYLFGPDCSFPLAADGSVSVELYDDTPLASGGKAVLKEQWNIDKDTLKRLLKKDMIGWGYTLFLPWGTYSPNLTRVHLMVRYTPAAGGAPLFAPSETVSLGHPDVVNVPQTPPQAGKPGTPSEASPAAPELKIG